MVDREWQVIKNDLDEHMRRSFVPWWRDPDWWADRVVLVCALAVIVSIATRWLV